MLDPEWTTERGYSHAAEIMRLLDEALAAKQAVLDRQASDGRLVRDLVDHVGRGTFPT
jgi:hypothetical protein